MKNISFCKGWEVLWYAFISAIYLTCPDTFAKPITKYSPTQQQLQISGTITDGVGTMPGVTVGIKGSIISAVTDLSGKYTINAFNTDILVFSYIGYKTVEIPIGSQSIINLEMKIDATNLQEVTINAGYYSVKDSERTGSIARITSKDIEKQPVTNVLATMQGRMAGVNITQTTGTPGGGFEIQIRGQNSLRTDANRPLYIIDGVPYASDPIGNAQTSQILPFSTNPLSSINPDQIESIEVLKDADATAIYGSRGANGVVLITTKKGKRGQTQFSANYSYGLGKVTRFSKLLNTEQYLNMRRQAFSNDGITEYPEGEYDINGKWSQTRYTDWQKKLLGGTSNYTNILASVSGGSDKTQFLISAGYNKETTVYPGDFRYQKGNVHVNLNHLSENEKFRVNFSTGFTIQDNNQPGTDLTYAARSLAPNAPELYDKNGKLNWEDNTFDNPLANLEGEFLAKTYDLIANTMLSYRILPSLEAKTSLGFTNLNHEESTTSPNTIYNPAYGITSASSSIGINRNNRQSWIIEPQLHWNNSFGELKVDVLVGGTFQQQTGNSLIVRGRGFVNNSLIYNLASAARITVLGNDESVYKYQAFFGRININWKQRYILNFTGRRDGSSRFSVENQFANFGALGAAWLFTKEAWLEDNTILSLGKLRASYGTTGNDQIGDYQFLNTYGTSSTTYQGVSGLAPTRLYNPNFGWETNKKLEVALETGFLKDRIFFTAAWYSNRSSNQLVGIPLPGTTGFSSMQANLNAIVENRGCEFTLRTENINNNSFEWTTSLNISLAKNELISFPSLAGSTYRNQFVIGESTNIRKLYQFTGVDSQTGLYQFKDFNGDGAITSDDKQLVRNFNPKYFGGIQNSLRYKQVQLDFLFQFVKQENLNQEYASGMPGMPVNQSVEVLNHWQQQGDIAIHQMFSAGYNDAALSTFDQYLDSNAIVSDASFIRLKNIALSFELPKRWTGGLRCLITAQGQNLITITKFKGADPEFTAGGYLPPLKIFTTGLQLTF
ncbi:SusC/RagA family TonB-linked outer membrane protein [Flavobacterium sp. PL02]|uniref:SusC/RagA family TonB-linked outer membrane protein n=1 Tax=Flavobacterium sp. PL02 TaxID=3088354 RepID=UPI002B229A39|nr:SusC/RagA family TonB-linked outer membrane protein [Flavobacterium sp. PL02]MEA9414304.1 SusC/RagA family TonB-linked outer membrane protein [Flavobacterium sp. PL02]